MTLSAGAQARFDAFFDRPAGVLTELSPFEMQDDLHELAIKMIGMLKMKFRGDRIKTVKAAAAELGIGYHVARGIAKTGKIWTGFTKVYSDRSRQSYKTMTVDIDELVTYIEQRKAQRVERAEKRKAIALDRPPVGLVKVVDLPETLCTYKETLMRWCRDGLIESACKLSIRNAHGTTRTWYAKMDDIVSVLREHIHLAASRNGTSRLRRDKSKPLTDMARELWDPLMRNEMETVTLAVRHLNKAQRAVFDYITEHPGCWREQVEIGTDIGTSYTYRLTRELVEGGLLERRGSRPYHYYVREVTQ